MSGWALAQPPISKRGRSHLFSALSRFAEQAQFVQPVLCVADTDNDCAKELLSDWLPRGATNDFLFRLERSPKPKVGHLGTQTPSPNRSPSLKARFRNVQMN